MTNQRHAAALPDCRRYAVRCGFPVRPLRLPAHDDGEGARVAHDRSQRAPGEPHRYGARGHPPSASSPPAPRPPPAPPIAAICRHPKTTGLLNRATRFEDRSSILAAKEPAADAKDCSFVPPSIAQAPARPSACCARRSGGARRSVKRRRTERTERTKRRRTRPGPRKRLRLRAPRPKSKSALERCAALATRTRVPLAAP